MNAYFKKKILWTVIIVLASFIILFPVYWTLSTSLKQENEIGSEPGRLVPRQPTLENYFIAWNSTPMKTYFKNSFFVAGLGALITVIIATLASAGFSRYKFIGKDVLFILILVFIMVPPLVYLIGQYTILSKFELLNSRLVLIVIYTATQIPFTLWLLKNCFDQIPRELDDAARIDGCNIFNMLLKVHVPIARSGIAGAFFLNFLYFWNEFIVALTILSSGSKRTVPVGIHSFIGMYGINYGPLLAAAILCSMPVLILFIFIGKQFVEGLTEGAIKG